jgi:RHS repeat-associated protein
LQNITLATTASVINNRISNVNSVAYTYDASGNNTGDGGHTYGYDAESRIMSVDGGASTYAYDSNNWRVKKVSGGVTTHCVWEGAQVIAEYNGSTGALISEYVFAGGRMVARDQGGVLRYLHQDRLSTRMITDATGAVVGTMDHLPFGEDPLTGSGESEKHRFTNYERDAESGTDYAINRQHQQANGRFMRPDPIQGKIEAPQSFNRYSYANGDPINLIDPLGLDEICTEPDGNGGFKVVPCPGDDPPLDPDQPPVILTGWAYADTPLIPDWWSWPLRIDGSGLIGGVTAVVVGIPNIKKKICGAIPSGRTIGVSGALGAVGSIVGGGEIVVNYNSGQVSAFGFGGTQAGWNGGASGSVYSGYVYGLSDSNLNYSRGFTGVNISPKSLGGGGVFAAASSGGIGDAKNAFSLRSPTVVGASLGASIIPSLGGVTTTHYSKPVQLGKFAPLLLSPEDTLLFTARQLCK